MFSLKGKNVLLTGSSGGIGQEIARAFHKQGANIILSGTNEDKLIDLSTELGERANYIIANLEKREDIDHLSSKAEEKLGHLDILVNNAGITSDNLFIRMKDEEWDKVLDVNLRANVRLTKNIIRGMLKRRFGRIIFISSIIGYTGNIGQSNYAASKSGTIGMSKSLSIEYAKKNITINCVSPGFIVSDMTNSIPEKIRNILLSKIPMGKMGSGDDVSNCVAFLSSDEASYITGETIHVNGGMYMA